MTTKRQRPRSAKMPADILTLKLKIDPYQGAAGLAASIVAPKGYKFLDMNRKGQDVLIRYQRIDNE